jgi:hypothetical protein
LGLQDGDRIILSFDDEGSLRLVSARQAARRTRGLLLRIAPALQDRGLAEELIAERRAEAARALKGRPDHPRFAEQVYA